MNSRTAQKYKFLIPTSQLCQQHGPKWEGMDPETGDGVIWVYGSMHLNLQIAPSVARQLHHFPTIKATTSFLIDKNAQACALEDKTHHLSS